MLSEELTLIDKLKKRINATVQQIGDTMMTGGVDSMEKYKYMLGQAHACLLYTSPSPRDRTRSRMPSSA